MKETQSDRQEREREKEIDVTHSVDIVFCGYIHLIITIWFAYLSS